MKSLLIDYLSRNKYVIPILFGLLTLVVLFLTLVPAGALGSSVIWSFDKIGHFLMFGSWTFLLGLYLYVSNSYTLNLFTIFFIGVSFGIFVELLQFVMPFQRSADLFDIAFDSIGSLFGVLFLRFIIPEKENE